MNSVRSLLNRVLSSQPQRPQQDFPNAPHGAAIIRTQGHRPALLAEALASVAAQSVAVTAFVVVHGDQAALGRVKKTITGLHKDTRILHATHLERRRSYPLNLALQQIYAAGDAFDFLFFLDDDDIVYPAFCQTLSEALRQQNVDVVYAASNRKVPLEAAIPAYTPLPPACLLVENFMPINSYLVRLDALRSRRPFFDEALEVLEDWHFLLQLLAMQLKFWPLGETLSEFRIISDGNTPHKQDQALWDSAWDRVHAFIDQIGPCLSRSYLLSTLEEFAFASRSPLTPSELQMVQKTKAFIAMRFPPGATEAHVSAPEPSRRTATGDTT